MDSSIVAIAIAGSLAGVFATISLVSLLVVK